MNMKMKNRIPDSENASVLYCQRCASHDGSRKCARLIAIAICATATPVVLVLALCACHVKAAAVAHSCDVAARTGSRRRCHELLARRQLMSALLGERTIAAHRLWRRPRCTSLVRHASAHIAVLVGALHHAGAANRQQRAATSSAPNGLTMLAHFGGDLLRLAARAGVPALELVAMLGAGECARAAVSDHALVRWRQSAVERAGVAAHLLDDVAPTTGVAGNRQMCARLGHAKALVWQCFRTNLTVHQIVVICLSGCSRRFRRRRSDEWWWRQLRQLLRWLRLWRQLLWLRLRWRHPLWRQRLWPRLSLRLRLLWLRLLRFRLWWRLHLWLWLQLQRWLMRLRLSLRLHRVTTILPCAALPLLSLCERHRIDIDRLWHWRWLRWRLREEH
jgi:hypothetical protein